MSAGIRKIAGAPISWGVCEVPGWGPMLPPERVLGEMAGLGLTATERGPDGYLPDEPAELKALLDRFGLSLVASFVPVVVHHDDRRDGLEDVRRQAASLAAAGGELMLLAPVADLAWSPPPELDRRGWENLAAGIGDIEQIAGAAGLDCCVHPHFGSLIETGAEIERLAGLIEVEWCFDTAHLMIGGVDPVEFVREHGSRIRHVHLKDVDARIARAMADREVTHLEAAAKRGFLPLGQGDAPVAEVIAVLDEIGYRGWMTLEQDTTLGEEPAPGKGPLAQVRASLEFIAALDAGKEWA